MEQCDLTVPEYPGPAITLWKVDELHLMRRKALIVIVLEGPAGEVRSFSYSGVTATNLMVALNTANLPVKSLHRRILERLMADGSLTGTISGTPD